MSKRYRKKQVEVEADLIFSDDGRSIRSIRMWNGLANPGDYIYKDANGSRRRSPAETFLATYEPVEETCATFDCGAVAVAGAEVAEGDDWARYCAECAAVLERAGDRVEWDQPSSAALAPLTEEDRRRLGETADRVHHGDAEAVDVAFLRSLADRQPEAEVERLRGELETVRDWNRENRREARKAWTKLAEIRAELEREVGDRRQTVRAMEEEDACDPLTPEEQREKQRLTEEADCLKGIADPTQPDQPSTPDRRPEPLEPALRASLLTEGAARVICSEVSGLSPDNEEDRDDVHRALEQLIGEPVEEGGGEGRYTREQIREVLRSQAFMQAFVGGEYGSEDLDVLDEALDAAFLQHSTEEGEAGPDEAELNPAMANKMAVQKAALEPGGPIAAATNVVMEMDLSDDAEQACEIAIRIVSAALRHPDAFPWAPSLEGDS